MRLDYDLIREMILQIEEDVNGSTNYDIAGCCEDRFKNIDVSVHSCHMKHPIVAGCVQAKNGHLVKRGLTLLKHMELRRPKFFNMPSL